MKQTDPLFHLLFKRLEYTGSFYDGLRIKKADEFDINLVLNLPFEKDEFTCSNDLLSNPNVLSSLIAVYVCNARVASWYTSASLCPPELQAIFGWMVPATGHSRRMCRILRSEWWQQVRFLRDCLRIACSRQPQQPGTNHRFQDWSRTSIQLTEFLWNQVRPNLPSKKKQRVKEGTVLVLGDRPVAEQHRQILKLGPKFCFEPALKRVDKLALSRLVSRQVPEEDKPRCVAGCVDVLLRSEGAPTRSRSLEPVIDFLATSGLRALVSDKEGFFVIMPEDMFAEKATCAVQKNFKAVLEKPAKVKERAVELLERLDLKQVSDGCPGHVGYEVGEAAVDRLHREGDAKWVSLLEKLMDGGRLVPDRVTEWLELVLDRVLRTYVVPSGPCSAMEEIRLRQHGPAVTLYIKLKDGNQIDVDLVPVIEFRHPSWPTGVQKKGWMANMLPEVLDCLGHVLAQPGPAISFLFHPEVDLTKTVTRKTRDDISDQIKGIVRTLWLSPEQCYELVVKNQRKGRVLMVRVICCTEL
ncbi:hypothetical protein HPB47_014068 [Ixodes persulcatus]|uniref:Uncharacterized protein n=1 Tax=Ixodes persulcatus TaxID=34615 RepID=A0AC60QZG8_IXOPE|nr:hypothetical protein HPB47_014068 [Ixodes persulcatus]